MVTVYILILSISCVVDSGAGVSAEAVTIAGRPGCAIAHCGVTPFDARITGRIAAQLLEQMLAGLLRSPMSLPDSHQGVFHAGHWKDDDRGRRNRS